MFRKLKSSATPLPKPPSKEQKIEDLQLFYENRATPQVNSAQNVPELTEESSIEDWWKVFESSIATHEQFHDMKANTEDLKKTIQDTREELQAACKYIQDQIADDLEKLRQVMECEGDK